MNDVEEEARSIHATLAEGKNVFVFLTQEQAEDIADEFFDHPDFCIADYDEELDGVALCHYLHCDSRSKIELEDCSDLYPNDFEEGNDYEDDLLVSYAAVRRYLLELAEAEEFKESEKAFRSERLYEQADVLRNRLIDDLECYVFLTKKQTVELRTLGAIGFETIFYEDETLDKCHHFYLSDEKIEFDDSGFENLEPDDFNDEEGDLFSFEIVKRLVERGMEPRKFKAKAPIRAKDTFTSEGPRPNLLGL